ncbi:MAG: hypothetical protein ACI4DU_10360 [Lachnospiraceae bacterium]
MKQNIIILYARPWSLTDEATGTTREGCSIFYLSTDNLKPCQSEQDMGIAPTKQSISVELSKKLKSVPGIYDATFDLRNSKQQLVLSVTDFDFISEIKK